MLTFERERRGTAVRFTIGPVSYLRIGRVVTLDAGQLKYRRIGGSWRISWRWA